MKKVVIDDIDRRAIIINALSDKIMSNEEFVKSFGMYFDDGAKNYWDNNINKLKELKELIASYDYIELSYKVEHEQDY